MLKLIVFIFSAFCLASCDQPNNHSGSDLDRADGKHETTGKFASILSDTTKPAIQKPMNKYYPFELQEIDGQYQIVANIEGKDLYPKYFDFFQEHGYEGNGYCWEGHITQILEKLDNKLLSQIDFDPEAGTFFANADSKEAQIKFAETLSSIFSDLKKLEDWVKKADRSRIDD